MERLNPIQIQINGDAIRSQVAEKLYHKLKPSKRPRASVFDDSNGHMTCYLATGGTNRIYLTQERNHRKQ